ncbi:MAG: hypothetical protein HUU21_36190 [Polyangiaceae bacterium]|nr:hypothetical protein [Polyangiaceae bacterium]
MLHGDGQQFTYTSFGLPRTITTPEGTTQLMYDAFGARVGKQGPGGTTISIRGLYESREGLGGLSHTFVVHSSDGPVAEIIYKPSEPNPRTVHYRHHDALGSVNVTTSPNSAVHRSYYEPFGGRIGFNGAPNASSMPDIYHGFTGHPHDDDLNLINMGGRIYSPSTRQFLTPDPLGRLGASPYSYVRNNPLNWIDPTGFTEKEPEGTWYSGFSNLFSSAPILAVDANPTLIGQLTAVAAAMDLPNGNDAPNSSGCPDGTGTAPRPCAAPGEAGCSPGAGLEGSYARYITPIQLSIDLPKPPGMTVEARTFEEEALEDEYYALLVELRASAKTDALIDEVHEFRTDPAKREALAQSLWGQFATRYEIEKLRLGLDLLLQGTVGAIVGAVVARGGSTASSYVYQLVDDAGEAVYYGMTNNPMVRLAQHARRTLGPFRGMQVISKPLSLPQAQALETSLIQQAQAEGRFLYNTAGSSISSTAPVVTPPTILPNQTLLNPKLYPWR